MKSRSNVLPKLGGGGAGKWLRSGPTGKDGEGVRRFRGVEEKDVGK